MYLGVQARALFYSYNERVFDPPKLFDHANDWYLPPIVSLSELVEALLNSESVLVSQPGKKMAEINRLLYFEPYSCFSGELFRELITCRV